MGLDVARLVIATNANDIMARALNEGVYEAGRAQHTLSPSMDIQVASNFERALFEASGRDAGWTGRAMADFARDKRIVLLPSVRMALAKRYAAFRTDDAETLATIRRVHAETGRLIDPHTAVAVAAAGRLPIDEFKPRVVLSTAHPAKFPDAVREATGQIPPLPPRLTDLFNREEKMTALAPDKGLVQAYITARVAAS